LPEIDLALGYELGNHLAWYREWLYWYDVSGNRYLTANERATQERLAKEAAEEKAHQEQLAKEAAEEKAHQERLAKEAAEEKAQRLAERLKLLGIDPDEI
jgi:hypothetical protein